jgi:hypothetical protein
VVEEPSPKSTVADAIYSRAGPPVTEVVAEIAIRSPGNAGLGVT